MVKLPSLETLKKSLLTTIIRYPWVVLIAVIKLVLLISYTETPNENESLRNILVRLSYVFFVAMPLVLSVKILFERRSSKKELKYGLLALVALLLFCYYFYISPDPNQNDYYRFILFMAASHLLVSFAGFIRFNEPNGFWQFNKTLFLQFLTATLYSVTLYAGLVIAVETVIFLFNIQFLFKIEADLFYTLFILFHTVFFLSKIPENLQILEEQTDYPSGLKIFTQYVLLPLEVVYLVILYAYTAKIIFQWQLPEGGVAYLVLAFSVAGILALLLLYPLRDTVKDRWVSLFSRRFYIAISPLILLLFAGISRRINDYGLTENRYLVAVLAIWLAGITIYSLVVKRNDIRWIPVSLSIISFFLAVGPWNIFRVAEKSQLKLFRKILTENKLLNSQDKIAGNAVLSVEDYEQLFSIVDFFKARDRSVIASYFPKFGENANKHRYSNVMNNFLEKHVSSTGNNLSDIYWTFSLDSETQNKIDIHGYNFMVPFLVSNNEKLTEKEYEIASSDHGQLLILYHNHKKIVSLDIKKKIEELSNQYENNSYRVPSNVLTINYENSGYHIKILITTLSGDNEKNYSVRGYFFYK
ncbi:DUF4153 domain-containing protein [Dyadobacter sp. CY356]|uniref:DUF4153 domain-containing protein n=1 Tax=Dyadobacter sp. CY356 TaxID=2906442 RepID=UPI001F1E7027|nr:DUF4153 domain-containing protein [Dyadobacter sp. CY356]MCF0056491.1 DUF4153 domain-containing protein [Dyadobacter sp. CY356]